MKKFMFFLIAIGFLGCATIIPDPTTTQSTLLIGQILHNGIGPITSGYAGKHKSGITFTIQNLETKGILTLVTDRDGVFARPDIPAGDYLLMKCTLVIPVAGGTFSTWLTPATDPNMPKFFTIQGGKVNNIGFVNWEMDIINKSYKFLMNKEYDTVQNYFKVKYPSSGWLEKEWVPVNVRVTNDKQKNNKPEL